MSAVPNVMRALTEDVAGAYAGRIIVAEDEVLVRLMLAEGLRAAGFAVVEALDGDEVISLLTTIPDVDAVLTDMHMRTWADGVAVLEFARAHHPHTLILLVSGHPFPEAARFDAEFRKPVDPGQVVAWLKEQMAARGTQSRGG